MRIQVGETLLLLAHVNDETTWRRLIYPGDFGGLHE